MDENWFRQKLGDRIAQLRSSAKITQEKLAEEVGIPRTAISQIEAGTRNVTAYELVELACALRVDVTDILDAPIPWTQERWMELARRNQASKLAYEDLAAKEWASNGLNIHSALKFRYLAEGVGIAQNHQISVSKEPT